MLSNESFYPVLHDSTWLDWNGILMREKLAHDYLRALLSNNETLKITLALIIKENKDVKDNNIYSEIVYSNLVKYSFTLADKFIEFSNTPKQ